MHSLPSLGERVGSTLRLSGGEIGQCGSPLVTVWAPVSAAWSASDGIDPLGQQDREKVMRTPPAISMDSLTLFLFLQGNCSPQAISSGVGLGVGSLGIWELESSSRVCDQVVWSLISEKQGLAKSLHHDFFISEERNAHLASDNKHQPFVSLEFVTRRNMLWQEKRYSLIFPPK